jgi:drug/metabolite transporter (DMT)-like permease
MMTNRLFALLLTVALSAVCVGCDYFLKRASALPHPFLSRDFWIGLAGYALSAFAWVLLLQRIKLATIGAIYCLTLIILLAAVGTFIFGEKLNSMEFLGLALGCISIFLLVRFA